MMGWVMRFFGRHQDTSTALPNTSGVLTAAAKTGAARRRVVERVDFYEQQNDPIGALVHDINQVRQLRVTEAEEGPAK